LSPKTTAILTKIEPGELTVRTADTVVFETVFSLQRGYKVPRTQIAQAVLPLLELPGIILPGKRAFRQVFERYCATPMGFADCYPLMMMRRLSLTEILTFDHDFDRVEGVARRKQ